MALEDVVDDVVALVPGEVDVEVGRTGAVRIDEALEVEVELERVDVRDVHAVRHDGVGARAAPDVVVAHRARVADDVPGDEEVAPEALLLDDGEFAFESLVGSLMLGAVALAATRFGEFAHERHIPFSRLGESLLIELLPALVKAEGAPASSSRALSTRYSWVA